MTKTQRRWGRLAAHTIVEMADIVDYFTRSDVVRIATERKSGDEVVTPIWGVVVHSVPYIAVNSEVDRAYEAKYAGQGQPLRRSPRRRSGASPCD